MSVGGIALEAGVIVDGFLNSTNLGKDIQQLIQQFKGNGESSGNSLKTVSSNKEANRIAKDSGYDGAEDLKEAFVGKSNISKFNMTINTETGEVVLVSISDSSIKVATGIFTK